MIAALLHRQRRARLLCGLLAALTAGGACIKHLSNADDRVRFSHAKHTQELGFDCATCHAEQGTSERPGDRALPGHEQCSTCHEDKVSSECTFCHANPATASSPTPRRPKIQFSHANHEQRVGDACVTCHADVPTAATLEETRLPGHDVCQQCHDAAFTSLDCQKCHTTLADVPAAKIAGFRHPVGWDQTHRIQARADSTRCAQCHMPSFCSQCHDPTRMGNGGFEGSLKPPLQEPQAVDRSFIHRGDFRTVHPIEAARDPAACIRCHDVRSCESCHRQNGVATDVIAGPHADGSGVHPADWISRHGAEARRNIVQCASCHERTASGTAICVTCHSDSDRDPRNGSGINPHPRGFDRAFSERTTVCRQCHPSGTR
jgi:hypothetical protein